MKSILGFLLGLIVLTSAMKLPGPPRGNDLNDHFGSNPSANKYGPISPVLKPGQLMRVGLHSGIPITPMTNFNQEINPKDVVAGDLLNTAPDALKIIKPHMAGKYINNSKHLRQRLTLLLGTRLLSKRLYI